MFRLGGIAWRVSRTLLPLPLPVLLTNAQKARGGGVARTEKGRMCLRYDFRNQNSARIGINLLPNVIKLFSDRTCIFHARSFPCSRSARVLAAPLTASLSDILPSRLRTLISFYYYGTWYYWFWLSFMLLLPCRANRQLLHLLLPVAITYPIALLLLLPAEV